VRALLISTYEMGRQPFGLASPAAWLKRADVEVRCVDLTRDSLEDDAIRGATLVGFHLPMHTATRLAGPVVRRVREMNPAARLVAYGLYAPLNAGWLRTLGVDDVLGGEFEAELAEIAAALKAKTKGAEDAAVDADPGADAGADPPLKRHATEGWAAERCATGIPRLRFLVPDRSDLPPLARYATLQRADGTRAVTGYTEASRGCRHLCRHCPVVPVYSGQFRIVQHDVVLDDVRAQVAAGARHITFGDPDFFNGPTHAMRIVEALHAEHPALTYDATIKVEHLLKCRELLPRLRDTGCAFVTSAVESVDDEVLAILDKGHTRREFIEAVALCRAAGLTLVPTFVAFHPWLTLESYCQLLDTIAELDLVDHVAPIQLAIRLLIPEASRLLEVAEVRQFIVSFDARSLMHRWAHPDPHVDRLHLEVAALVGGRLTSHRRELFDAVRALACERAGRPSPDTRPARDRASVPYLNEPWYC
jgi:radical SAM superfamily enzyme YgiQ (UPF0313 family)